MKTIKKYIQLPILILLVFASSFLSAETVTYYINDVTGSPIAAMEQSGSVIWRESYNPYGEGRIKPSQNEDDVGFTGHQKDDFTGLTYMQARYYDPIVGRFYGVDPVGYVQKNPVMSFNRYLYVNNNPYKYTDPNGEYAQIIYGAIAGAVGGYVASGDGFKNTAVGIIAGAVAGGAVGFYAPQTSHLAGMAAAGMVASAAGQVAGSAMTTVNEKGIGNVTAGDITSGIKVDAVTTIAGGLGAGAGGLVAKGVANMTMKPLVGQSVKSLSQLGGPTTAGTLAGAVVEGAITGVAEKVAPIINEKIKEVTQ